MKIFLNQKLIQNTISHNFMEALIGRQGEFLQVKCKVSVQMDILTARSVHLCSKR